jgi:purine-cytosine permease-like protein
VDSGSGSGTSRARRFASTVYDARRGGRSTLLDGPWWLGVIGVAVFTVLIFGSRPWTWLAVPLAAAFFWVPSVVRWGSALWRSVGAFRQGYRS